MASSIFGEIPTEFEVNHKIEPLTMLFLAGALFFVFGRKKKG